MELGRYIHDLLFENEIVIVPGFGAFVSIRKPSEIDEKSGEIKPPSKEVLFNRQIRNNDGLLVGYIAEQKNISHFDALKKIEKERENIVFRLDKGEKVKLKNTGILYVAENNEIQLEPFEEENLLLDSFGLENTGIEDTFEDEAVLSPVAEDGPAKETTGPVTNKKEKKGGWLWFLLILIPLGIAGIFVIKKNKEVVVQKDKIVADTLERNENIAVAKSDTFPKDTVLTAVTDSDSVKTEEVEADSSAVVPPETPQFYLVGGSFRAKENAEKYLQQLKSEGYEPFHLGKKGSYFIVGIGKYQTEAEASKAKHDFLAKSPGSGVWVYKK